MSKYSNFFDIVKQYVENGYMFRKRIEIPLFASLPPFHNHG